MNNNAKIFLYATLTTLSLTVMFYYDWVLALAFLGYIFAGKKLNQLI